MLSLAKGNKIPKDAQEICRLYNNNSCRYRRCKYRHVCVVCGGKHPATRCSEGVRQQQAIPEPVAASNRQSRRESASPY